MNKIPLLLLNGSLGSGKTTLVRRLLKSKEFAGSFVIENEYASVNIDRESLVDDHDHDHEIYEISGNCICCSTGEELEAALDTVIAQGWGKPAIIEATGMANSAILLRRLFLNPRFTEHFRILSTILMIDAVEVSLDEISQAMLLEAQLSDVIVINKSDLASDTAEKLREVFSNVNSEALVVRTSQAEIDISSLTQIESHTEVSFARVFPEIDGIELDESTYAVLDLDRPLDPQKVRQAFESEVFAPGIQLRRAKGFFIDHNGEQWQLEATAKHTELRKLRKPKRQVLVAIGKGITKKALKETLL